MNNFASGLDVGQVSAVSVNPNDQPVIFHRGHVKWDANTFGSDFKMVRPTLIGNDTIVTLDADSGKPVASFGKNMFLMPHGLTVDAEGNVYVTDVGLHQVMRVSKFYNVKLKICNYRLFLGSFIAWEY